MSIELTDAVLFSASSTSAFIVALLVMFCVETRSFCSKEVACENVDVMTASSLCIDPSTCKLVVRTPFAGRMTNDRRARDMDW